MVLPSYLSIRGKEPPLGAGSSTTRVGDGDHSRSQENLLRPVTPQTIPDQVAGQLRQLIACGEYKQGDRIPAERELATQLGVGRPAVREALRELKAQGLLASGRGAQGPVVAALPGPQFAAPLAALLGGGAGR